MILGMIFSSVYLNVLELFWLKVAKKKNKKNPKCLKKKICYTAAKIALGDKS